MAGARKGPGHLHFSQSHVTNKLFGSIAFSVLVGAAAGCDSTESVNAEPVATEQAVVAGVIDSIFPIEEEIRRFAETVDREPAALSGGANSRDGLVENFIQALERSDTAALAAAIIDRAEFIHLYFPHTVYTRPPYELDPAIVWFQMMNNSSRGMTRAHQRFAGRDLGYRGYRCGPETAEGPNRIWDRCVVRIAPEGEPMELRLFGLIVERDGEYKFVTYGNDL